MANFDELKYSPDAQRARAKIYEDYNDITIYVEDNSIVYEYEEILKHLFKDKYHFSAIIPLGGKEEVFKTYRQYEKENHQKKYFYILDGDFNRYISPEEMIRDTCVYYLEAYSIESYIINEKGAKQFAKGKLKMTDDKVNSKIQFDMWRNRIVSDFHELYFVFCAIQAKELSLPNCEKYRYKYLNSKTGFKSVENPVEDYLEEVSLDYSIIEENVCCSKELYNTCHGEDYYYLIDGKLLLKSLYLYLKKVTNTSFRENDLRWALITSGNLDSLKELKQSIIACYPA